MHGTATQNMVPREKGTGNRQTDRQTETHTCTSALATSATEDKGSGFRVKAWPIATGKRSRATAA